MAQNTNSESFIDRRYREEYLRRLFTVDCKNKGSTWSFACPYCSEQETKDWKRNKKTACLIWNSVQNSWKFACQRCGKKTNFFHALHDLDPLLGAQYQREREQAGTTGWGHDCPSLHLIEDDCAASQMLPIRPIEALEHHQNSSSVSPMHLTPMRSPQQQAGHQSHLNNLVKRHQQKKSREPGDFWLS